MDSSFSPESPHEAPEAAAAHTRLAIREAAKRLFLHQGYHQVSMRALAAEAGISTGPLYFHYRNKSDVFFDICMEALSRLNGEVEQAAASGPGPGSASGTSGPGPEAASESIPMPGPGPASAFRLREIFRAFQRFYEREPLNSQLVRLCFNPLFGIGFSPRQVELLMEKKSRHMEMMEEVIRQGVAGGELKELDTTRFMLILYAVGDGIFSARENGDLERFGIPLDGLMEEASRLLYTGIVKKEGDKS